MKRAIYSLFLLAAAFLLLPNQADAQQRHHRHQTSQIYRSGYSGCGCAIYTRKYVRGYDCYGSPIYAYARVPVKHRCRHYKHNSHYRCHPNNYRYHRGRYYHNRWHRNPHRHCQPRRQRTYVSPYGQFSIRF